MESAIATSQEWTTFRSTQLAEATESKAGQDLPTQRRDNDHKRPRRKPKPMRITRSTQPIRIRDLLSSGVNLCLTQKGGIRHEAGSPTVTRTLVKFTWNRFTDLETHSSKTTRSQEESSKESSLQGTASRGTLALNKACGSS